MKNYILLLLLCFLSKEINAQKALFIVSDPRTVFCESVSISFTNTSTPAANTNLTEYRFLWHFGKPQQNTKTNDSTATGNKVSMTFNRAGIHNIYLEMTDRDNVKFRSDTLTIVVRPRPNPSFTIADTFDLGDLTYRFLSGKSPDNTVNYIYEWYLDPKESKDPVTENSIKVGGRNLLILYDVDSGKHEMKLRVTDPVLPTCRDSFIQAFRSSPKMYFPTAFTPNGDNLNDFFHVQTNGRNVYSFQVFNSRGILIFKSESRSIIWDGYDMNGKKALAGIYYFVIQTVEGDEPLKEVGYVMLLR